MAVIEINRNPTRRQLNQFGLLWLAFFAFWGAVAFFKFQNQALAVVVWAASIGVPVVGWLIPSFMRLVFVGMSYAAWPIGFVVSHVVLAIVYYLVLTPIGLMMRIFGYDPMRRRFESDRPSYWVRRQDAGVGLDRYFRQF